MTTVRYWAVIPAAGAGKRMQAGIPKQYLEIDGRTILEITLRQFCSCSLIEGVIVALSGDDKYFGQLEIASHEKIRQVIGGEERCHSVLNSLHFLSTIADENDWVLVHDAARPCIDGNDIENLIRALDEHPVGGLLALPVRDTMKRAEEDNLVTETVNREGLWHALTPQMFRLGQLTEAMQQNLDAGRLVTDESQAMELAGLSPMLVSGRQENIKITHMDDLRLAKIYLKQGT